MKSPKIYLAGPDVFYRDARQRLDLVAQACLAAGFAPIKPFEDEDKKAGASLVDLSPREISARIFQDNLAKVRECDAVLANLESFRGLEPDSGTVFEIGFAVALGKPVVGYLPDSSTTLCEKVSAEIGLIRRADGSAEDAKSGMLVEDFGLPLNLMIANSVVLCVDYLAGVDALRELLQDIEHPGRQDVIPYFFSKMK